MLNANWVQETTVTAGTGTITLAGAVTGFVSFTQVFTDQSVVVYTIVNGNNREDGIGTFTTSGTTLARTFVRETLVGGVFDDTTPTPITLSGTSTVFVSPLTDAVDQRMPPISNHFYGSDLIVLSNEDEVISMTADDLYLIPFVPAYAGNYDGIGVGVQGVTPGAIMRLGIYTVDLAGVPIELIAETPDIVLSGDFQTEIGAITSTHIRRAEYAFAYLCDTAITIIGSAEGTSGSSYLGINQNFVVHQWAHTAQAITPGWTQLPTSGLTFGTLDDGRRPFLFLRAT